MSHEEFAKTMIVTRRVLRQKEITVSMTDGRYAKNEIIIHLTGLEPSFDPGQAVQEAANAMDLMQEKNPILPVLSPKAKQLVDKTMKGAEAKEGTDDT
jgi:hypothetical protein